MRLSSPVISLLVLLVFFNSLLPNLQAAEPAKNDNRVAGRILDKDYQNNKKQVPLPDALVRIVELKTGAAYQDTTDKNGCYDIEKVPEGLYNVSVTYKQKDYLFAGKLNIIHTDHPKNLFKVCYWISPDGSLNLVDEKDCHLCKKFPLYYLLIAAAGTGIIIGVTVPGGKEASPTTP